MQPAAQQDLIAEPTPTQGEADPRVEAFREFLAALDRTESVLTPMRRLRRLGLSVCVVSPQASRRDRTAEGSLSTGETKDGEATILLREERPPLLVVDVAGQPVSWQPWDDDELAARCRRDRLDDWLTAVARAALIAVGPGMWLGPDAPFPLTGPVHVDLTFVAQARHDQQPGSPWICPVKPNGTKADPSVPNLDGLAWATLGALVGIALADVSQVASIAARKVYGPSSAASIKILPA